MLDVAQVPTNEERPSTPPAKTVRLTRRQQARLEEEQGQTQRAASPPPEPAPVTEEEVLEALVKTAEQEAVADEAAADTHEEAPAAQTVRLTRRQQARLEEEKRQTERAASPHLEPKSATHEAPGAVEEVVEEEAITGTPTEDASAGAQEVHVGGMEEAPLEEVPPSYQEAPVDETQDEFVVEPEMTKEAVETQELQDTTPKIKQVEDQHSEEHSQKTTATEVEPFEATETEHEALTPSVEITSEPEPKTLASEKPIEDVATPLRSHTSSRRCA
jgi:hypothetical protein